MNEQHSIPNPNLFSKPYFFFSNDRNFEISFVTPSVEDVLGFSPAEVIGRKFTDFLDATSPLNDDFEICQRYEFRGYQARQRNSVWVVETKDRQNKVLSVQTYGTRDRSEQYASRHGLAQDVTDKFIKEQELHCRLLELKSLSKELTDREVQVLNFVIDGKLNKWIAKMIGVTERTIENVRARVMRKFQTETTAELAAKAKELQLLTEIVSLFDNSIGRPNFLVNRTSNSASNGAEHNAH